MPTVKRTIRQEGVEDQVEMFHIPLNKSVCGPGVNNKVIYDLKKRRKSVVMMGDKEYTFEVVHGH